MCINKVVDDVLLERELEREVEETILEIANMYNEVTTSDLQGMVMVKAKEIIKTVRQKDSNNIIGG